MRGTGSNSWERSLHGPSELQIHRSRLFVVLKVGFGSEDISVLIWPNDTEIRCWAILDFSSVKVMSPIASEINMIDSSIRFIRCRWKGQDPALCATTLTIFILGPKFFRTRQCLEVAHKSRHTDNLFRCMNESLKEERSIIIKKEQRDLKGFSSLASSSSAFKQCMTRITSKCRRHWSSKNPFRIMTFSIDIGCVRSCENRWDTYSSFLSLRSHLEKKGLSAEAGITLSSIQLLAISRWVIIAK